jgi:RNA polymerase sigma-70 factor (ECF subfamily)
MRKSGSISKPDLYLSQQLAAGGDQEAYKEIYYHYFKKLCLFAQAIVKVRESAEEIAEDVFIKIWQHKEKLAGINNLRVYLYTATKNTALNYLSAKARANIVEPFDHINIELSKTMETPEQIIISDEMLDRIQRVVEHLPPRCKMIFKLVREDGLRYKEVAEILNISVHTIDIQMAIAIRKILLSLRPDEDWLIPNHSKLSAHRQGGQGL